MSEKQKLPGRRLKLRSTEGMETRGGESLRVHRSVGRQPMRERKSYPTDGRRETTNPNHHGQIH